MIHEVKQLAERVAQLLDIVRRLSDENVRLTSELAASQAAREDLNARMAQARTRVEVALARLPATTESQD